jgi:hypothetical protein
MVAKVRCISVLKTDENMYTKIPLYECRAVKGQGGGEECEFLDEGKSTQRYLGKRFFPLLSVVQNDVQNVRIYQMGSCFNIKNQPFNR